MIYLVRHAKAGSRSNWDGIDELRPLSSKGHKQALALALRLAPICGTTLLSSPYVRCVETLEPLAIALAERIQIDVRLAEGGDFPAVIDMFSTVADGAVLCSHGDVIPETIAALERRGCRFTTAPEWRKASVWVLSRNAAGEVTEASAWPPPES